MGADFLAGLDVDKIQRFSLQKGGDDESKMDFVKEGKNFILESHGSYPANSNSVNQLLYDLSKIQIQEKVSGGSHEGLGVTGGKAHAHIIFKNDEGKTISEFFLGNHFNSRGRYLRMKGSDDVYLSKRYLKIPTKRKNFLNLKILPIDGTNVDKIEVAGQGQQFSVSQSSGTWSMNSGKSSNAIDAEKLKKFALDIINVAFVDYKSARDSKYSSLKFNRFFSVKLKNNSVYELKLARLEGLYILKASGTVMEMPSKVLISSDTNKEEIAKIEEMAKSQGRAQNFNLFHGPWIYEIEKSVWGELVKVPKDFSNK